MRCDVAIVGGGVGGCAAALAACELGADVILVEPTPWVGGQLTTQGVPPDEHPWIEEFGCTRRYRKFRSLVRDAFRQNYDVTTEARADRKLNPGGGWVSELCAPPKVYLEALRTMLGPHQAAGHLRILTDAEIRDANMVKGGVIRSLTGDGPVGPFDIRAEAFIDATETGDLLPLTGTDCFIGAESRRETGEPHAPESEDFTNHQAFTWCFAMGFDPTREHVIEKPKRYDFWRTYRPDFWPGPFLGWDDVHPHTLKPRRLGLFNGDGVASLFEYRKILDRTKLRDPSAHDVTLVNWPMNDYLLGNIVDVSGPKAHEHRMAAKELSLCLLYWMQTEAPRPDGGKGHPGLYAVPDLMGTDDGFAIAPYIRESRRIKAVTTIVEQDLSPAERPGALLGERYPDTVGVGYYRIDLHPSTAGDNYIDIPSLPFHIPLGALIPRETRNLIAGAKNIGTTHITNGCYRLHPVEWNIGEAAGTIAAYCALTGKTPRAVPDRGDYVADVQNVLIAQGVEIDWPAGHRLP